MSSEYRLDLLERPELLEMLEIDPLSDFPMRSLRLLILPPSLVTMTCARGREEESSFFAGLPSVRDLRPSLNFHLFDPVLVTDLLDVSSS